MEFITRIASFFTPLSTQHHVLADFKELKQLMGSLASKPNELTVYAADKCIATSLSLGIRPETLSKNMKIEINESTQKILIQAKLQENMQLAQREITKQRDQGMDLGF